MLTKDDFRQKNRRLLKETNDEYSEMCEQKVLQKLLLLDLKGKNILIYNSKPPELCTKKIIEALSRISNVFLPRTAEEVEIVRYNKHNKFHAGKFGIEEPEGIAENKNILDIAILPCVAVDKNGSRLGNGYGYFDRFLQGTSFLRIAICFDFQLEEIVPSDSHDEKMDIIITEQRVIET